MSDLETHSASRANGRSKATKTTAKTKPKPKPRRGRLPRNPVPADRRWLSWADAESISGLSRNTLRHHLAAIGARKVHSRTIIDRHALDEWMSSQPLASP